MRVFRIVLDVFGAMFIVLLALVAFMFWKAASPSGFARTGIDNNRVYLNWSGLNGDQDFSVVAVADHSAPIGNDSFAYACLEISDTQWKNGDETNGWLTPEATTASVFEWVKGWAGKFNRMDGRGPCLSLDDAHMFVRRAEFSSKPRMDGDDLGLWGFDVMFLERPTGRFLYARYQE